VNASTPGSAGAEESFDVVQAAAVLGVSPFVDARVLRRCYRRLLLEHHPDRHADGAQLVQERRTREIVAAFGVLDARISAAEARFRASRSLAEAALRRGLKRSPGRMRSATELVGYVSLTIGVLTVAYAVVPL
jgi:hypothetical protein